MTVVQPNGISGVTSVTSSTDVIEFYSSDYSSLAALNVNINSNSGVSTFNNVQVGNGSSLLVGVSTFSVGTAGSVGVGSAIPDKDFVVSGESRFKDWINGDANSKIHIAGNIVIPATYKIYVDGGSNTYLHEQSADNIAFVNAGAESCRLDGSGRLLIGHTATTSKDRQVQLVGTTADGSAYMALRHSADANGSRLDLCKSRNATPGSNTIVQDGDVLGSIDFLGDDGTDVNSVGASIEALVGGTPGSNDMPGVLTFKTTADGAAAATERVRIDSSGRLLLGTTSSSSPIGWNNNLQVAGTSAVAGVSIRRDSADTGGALLVFGKSRGSLNGNTVVQNNDQIGGMYFAGGDGTDVNSIAAQVSVEVDGTPGGNDMPGRILFKTTADGAASPTTRVRITSAGHALFSGMTDANDTRNVKGISIKSPGGVSFQSFGANGSRNWRIRPDDLGGWADLDFSCAPTDGSTDIPDAAADNVLSLEGDTKDVKVVNGDLFFGTAAKGIVLGATSNTDANTLEDYEEGTWSPSHDQGTEPGWHVKTGAYVKVGSLVHLDMWLQASGTTSSNSNIEINVPFACSNTTSSRPTSSAARCYSLQNWGSYRSCYGFMTSGNSLLNMMWVSAGGNPTPMTMNIWRNGAEVHCSISYRTNA